MKNPFLITCAICMLAGVLSAESVSCELDPQTASVLYNLQAQNVQLSQDMRASYQSIDVRLSILENKSSDTPLVIGQIMQTRKDFFDFGNWLAGYTGPFVNAMACFGAALAACAIYDVSKLLVFRKWVRPKKQVSGASA